MSQVVGCRDAECACRVCCVSGRWLVEEGGEGPDVYFAPGQGERVRIVGVLQHSLLPVCCLRPILPTFSIPSLTLSLASSRVASLCVMEMRGSP